MKKRRPALRKKTPLHRRARACPSPCGDRETGPRHRSRHPTIAGDRPPRYGEKKRRPFTERSRGTGPRATIKKRRPFTERSRGTGPRPTKKNAAMLRRAGACPPPCGDREGQALALRKGKAFFFHRRAGACQRDVGRLMNLETIRVNHRRRGKIATPLRKG